MNDDNEERQFPHLRWKDFNADAVINTVEQQYIIQAKDSVSKVFSNLSHEEFAKQMKFLQDSTRIQVKFAYRTRVFPPLRRTTTKKVARIYKPPGYAMTSALRFLLPKKVFERVVEQMILDAREEHAEALAEGRPKHAQWIAIRLYLMVGLALLTKAAMFPFEKFSKFMQKD